MCIIRFFDDDAWNPSALSYCSTGPSPPLAHEKSTLSPSQANAARCLFASWPIILPLSLNFRRSGSSQSENSSAMWNTIFSCSLNSCFVSLGEIKMIYFACICKKFAVFCHSQGLCSRKRCQRQYEPGAAPRPAVSRCGRPRGGDLHLSATDTGRLGVRSLTLTCLAKARNGKIFTNARKNVSFLLHRRIANLSFWDMDRCPFISRSNFPTAMSRFFANLAKAAKS